MHSCEKNKARKLGLAEQLWTCLLADVSRQKADTCEHTQTIITSVIPPNASETELETETLPLQRPWMMSHAWLLCVSQ